MANYNATMISSDDKFKSMREVIRQLKNNVIHPNYFISRKSRDEVEAMINALEAILGLEVALHSQNDTYNPINGVADMENRHINVSRNIDMAEEALNCEFEAAPEQQSGNGQYQQSACLDQHALSSRDQSNSSPPSNEADDQASVARSRTSGSCQRFAPYYCKTKNCLAAGKPFRFLSKLKDHERSHQAPSFTCRECNQKFKQSRILKKHIARVHKPNHTQGVAGGTHGTVSDVTYHDLDETSKMHALNMQAQTFPLQTDAFSGINPDAFRNPYLIDYDPGLIDFYTSPKVMSDSGFGSVVLDGDISAGGSPDYSVCEMYWVSDPTVLTAGQC
ncbi:hypothetical protein DFP73DRAFT_585531 [Morchella snyderi]|nr:hypothetical protein DFP73DRAFT_585531 [Morchella snyderi]